MLAEESLRQFTPQRASLTNLLHHASLLTSYPVELHQMNSPDTAEAFLESLLESSAQAKASLDDATQFASYIVSSWKGILKSQGVLI